MNTQESDTRIEVSIAICNVVTAARACDDSPEIKAHHLTILDCVRRLFERSQYDAAYGLVRDLVAFADDDDADGYKARLISLQDHLDLLRK